MEVNNTLPERMILVSKTAEETLEFWNEKEVLAQDGMGNPKF